MLLLINKLLIMYTLNFFTLPGWIALISLFLVLGQLVLTFLFSGDTNLDIDGGDGGFDVSTVMSPKGVLHFLFGASWYLVLIQPYRPHQDWYGYDWIIAICVGIVVAFFVALLYYLLSKLACEKKKESGEELVGRSVTIYLHTSGSSYDGTVVISEMKTTIPVKSLSGYENYEVGEQVEIVKYENGIYYIV